MIDYETFCKIRQLLEQKKLKVSQIAAELQLDIRTVRLRDLKAIPALMFTDGNEITYGKTETAWLCRFPLEIRIVFPKSRNAGPAKDTLVAEVQKTLEADITLGGLGRILNAGNEQPNRGPDAEQTHSTLLIYTIEYTRRIADPYLSS